MPKAAPSKMVVAETFGAMGLGVTPKMALEQRIQLMRNLGHAQANCLTLATQDRASSVLQQLALLVEQSGNPDLVAQANAWLERWNRECDPVFMELLRTEHE
jgi:hypothetical protein